MKITPKNLKVNKFQTGGTIQPDNSGDQYSTSPAPQEPAQIQEQEQDPIIMLAQMSTEALQNQDCQLAMQVCQVFVDMVQQMQGESPVPQQGEPVYKAGGTLVRRIKK